MSTYQKGNEAKPPNFPKPVRTMENIEREKMLKNRLKLKWGESRTPFRDTVTHPNMPTKVDDMTVKGFGEQHFADSVHEELPMAPGLDMTSSLFDHSSAWAEGAPHSPGRTIGFSKVLNQSSQYQDRLLDSVSMSLQARTTRGPVKDYSNRMHYTHRDVSQSLIDEGYPKMVKSLVSDADFCYVESVADDFYRFGVKSTVPEHIVQNQYATISGRGLLRNVGDNSELVSLPVLAHEATLYHKLGQLKVFRKYREWKQFYVWKHSVRRNRFEKRRMELEKNIIMADKLCRDLIFEVRKMLGEFQRFPLFYRDDTKMIRFAEYLEAQRAQNKKFAELKTDMMERIVEMLCSKCEHHLFEAAANAPNAITVAKYQSMKLNALATSSSLQEAANTAHKVIYMGLSSNGTGSVAIDDNASAFGVGSVQHQNNLPQKPSSISPRAKITSDKFGTNPSIMNASISEEPSVLGAGSNSVHEQASGFVPGRNFDVGVSYTIRSAIRLNCRRLLSLFRMIDYMIRDILYDSLRTSISSFLLTIEKISVKNHIIPEFGCSPQVILDLDVLAEKMARNPKGAAVAWATKRDEDAEAARLALEQEGIMNESAIVGSKAYVQEKAFIPATPLFTLGTEMRRRLLKSKKIVSQESVMAGKGIVQQHDSQGGMSNEDETLDDVEDDIVSSLGNNFGHRGIFKCIAYLPSIDEATEEFQQILREVCLICMYPEGLFFHERCIKMFEPVKNELSSHQLEDRIFLDNPINNPVQQIVRSCVTAFVEDFRYVIDQFECLNILCDKGNSCEAACSKAIVSRLHGTSADEITAQLNIWDDQSVLFGKLVNFLTIGIFRMDLSLVKRTIVDVIGRAQDLYVRIVPDLYVHYGDEFFRDVSKYTDNLGSKVNSLEDFIKCVEAYNIAVTKVNDVNDRYFYISSLRSIIEVRKIPQNDGILRQNLTLSSAYQRFSNCVAEFESQVEMQVKVYGTEIANRLKAIMVPIQEFTDYVQSINHTLINETKEPNAAAIVAQLSSCRKDIDQVGLKLKQLDYYQGLLNLAIFERGLEREIEDILQSQLLLWKSWMTFGELTSTFMAVHFLDANCDGILKDVVLMRNELLSARYFHQMREVIANSDPNSVDASNVKGIYSAYELLLKNMNQMIHIAPLIKELQSPTLKTMHVNRIQTIIGQNIFDETELTVGELVDVHNIIQYASDVRLIYKESRVLYHLETTLQNVTKAASLLKFEFAVEQENKSLSFVCNFDFIAESIEDYTHSLFACRHSPYSGTITAEITEKLEDLKAWTRLLRQFRQFQTSYLVLRSLFTSPRTARQISPFMRNFKSADENWRLLIKNARDSEFVEAFLNEKVVLSSLKHATENIKVIQNGFRDLRREQCEKYPKLFLMDDSQLEALYINTDIKSVFLECSKIAFPFLVEDAIFDYQEPYNVNTIICGGEKIVFQKSCSGRTNLSDWLKACEFSVKERFEKDLKSLMQEENRPVVDEIRNGRFTGQAQIVKLQLKFWSALDRILMDHIVEDKHEILAKLKAYLMELNDQVTIVGSVLSDPVNARTVMLVSNIIMTFAHFREVIQATYDDLSLYLSLGNDHEGPLKSPFGFSALQYPLKKVYDTGVNAIMVQQGCFRERYGMMYQGFQAKLVITPLTERCIYAMTTTFHSLSSRNRYFVPVLSGQSNRSTMKLLAYEMGIEYFHFDVARLSSTGQNFFEKISNALKLLYTSTTLWVSLSSSEPLSATHTAILGNVIAIFTKRMNEFQHIHYMQQLQSLSQTPGSAASTPAVNVAVRPLSNADSATPNYSNSDSVTTNVPLLPPFASGKLFLINASRLLPTIKTAQSTFAFLRPFHTPYIPLEEIIFVLLQSYNFVFIQKLVIQLEAFQTYLVNNGWVQENVFRRLLIRAIHALGVENEHQMMNASTQMSLIVKKFISELLRVHRKVMSEQDLRLLYNLYLEAIYNPETDCPTTMTMQLEMNEVEQAEPATNQSENKEKTDGDDEENEEDSMLSPLQRSPKKLLCELLQQQNLRLQTIQTQNASTVFPGDPDILESVANTRHGFYCIVGEPGVGKTTMIKTVLNNVETILAATPQKILEMLPEYIRVHPHRLNPALLNCRPGAVIFGDIDDSDGVLRAIGDAMKQSTTNRDWHFFHFDLWKSSQYLDYLLPAQTYMHQRFPLLAASVFCEMTDLQDLTPNALASLNLIWMPNTDRDFTFDDVLNLSIKKYASTSGHFRAHLKAFADVYLRPCLTSYTSITKYPQNIYVLIDRILQLTVLLFQYFAFPSQNALSSVSMTASSVEEFTSSGVRKGISPKVLGRYDEDSLRRVMVFACIWVIGSSSYNHRQEFEAWFRTMFIDDHKEYLNRNKQSIYPFFDAGEDKQRKSSGFADLDNKFLQTRSIFDYVLKRTDAKQWNLEWVHAGNFFLPSLRDDKDGFTAFSASRDSLLFTDQLISANRAMSIVPTVDYVTLSLVHAAMMHTSGILEQGASGLLLYSEQHGTGRSSLMQNLACQSSSHDNPFSYFATAPRWIYYGRDDKSSAHVQKAISTAQIRFEHQRIERGLSNFGAIFIDDVSLLSDHHQHNHDGASGGMVVISRAGEVLRSLLEQREYFDPTSNTFKTLWYPAVVASIQVHQHSSRSEGDRAWTQQFHRFAQHFFLYEVTPMQVREVLSNYLRMSVGWGIEYDMLGEISQFTHFYFEQLHRVVSLETEQNTWLSERSFAASERLLLISLRDTHPSVWSAWVIKHMAASIRSLDSVSQLDIVKVWDRAISDLSVRHILYPKIQEILQRTMEFCLNGPPHHSEGDIEQSNSNNLSSTAHLNHAYGSMLDMSSSPVASMLEKERSVRMSNLDMLQQSAIAPGPDDAISYTRNCVGFFRTGMDVFPTLYTMEYVRDTVWKNLQHDEKRSAKLAEEFPFYSMLLRTQRSTAGFWTDILRFVTVIACNQLSHTPSASPTNQTATNMQNPSFVNPVTENSFAHPRAIMLVPTTNMHAIHPRVFFAAQFFSNVEVETLSIGCAKVHAASSMMMASKGGDITAEGGKADPLAAIVGQTSNDIEMRLIGAILLDNEVLRRFKEHLSSYGNESLVDPLVRNALTSRYGEGLVSLIAQAEAKFAAIDLSQPIIHDIGAAGGANLRSSFMSSLFGQPSVKETVWIIENDDDFTGDSHDPRRIASYFQEVMQMMSLETPQLFEFMSLLNPLLDPRLFDNVRRALINFQHRQHIVFSVRALYADQLGHILRTSKRLMKIIHLHPESDEAEKLTKLLEVLPDKLEIGMDRTKFMNTLHGFADWYKQERSKSLNRMVFEIEEYNIFDMVQRLLQKEDEVKNVDLKLKMLHYLIRLAGFVEPKSAHGEVQALFLPQMITWEGGSAGNSGTGRPGSSMLRSSASFAARRRSSTGVLMVGPAYAASFVLACDMMFVSSALHCDAWVIQHAYHGHHRQHHVKLPHRRDLHQLSMEATIHENEPLENSSNATHSNQSANHSDSHPSHNHHHCPVPEFLYNLLEPLLHEQFLNDVRCMQSLMMTMAMTHCLCEVPFATPKWDLVHKMFRFFLLLPGRSTCKGFFASLSYGIASESTLVINDYTFLAAPFLDHVLDHDLHLGNSAANMSDVNMNIHCLSWKIHPIHHYHGHNPAPGVGGNKGQSSHKRKHDIEDLAATTVNITRADIGIATDLLLIHLLNHQMFAGLHKELQDAWDRKVETVRQVMESLKYLTDNLQDFEQLPGMKFQNMLDPTEEEEFDNLWHDARHRLIRAMEANIILSTNMFKFIRTYEKTRQFVAWFSSFVVLLEDSIMLQDHDTKGEELSHNIGLASMKALSMLSPHMVTHEGDRLWLLFSIFLDYFFVIDSSRSEYVLGELGRMQLLQCLNSLTPTEAISKKIGLDAFLGIVKKEKIVSNNPTGSKNKGKLTRHPSNIHAIAEEDSGNDDDSSVGERSSRADSDSYVGGESRNMLNDLVVNAMSFKEYTVIASHSRAAIKQALQAMSQMFSTGSLNRSFYATYCTHDADDTTGSSAEKGIVIPTNSLTILAAIDSSIDEWIEWASDTTTDLQDIPWNTAGESKPPLNPLEELLIILVLKPALLPQVLFDKICVIGYNIDPVTVRALLLSEESLKRGFHHTDRMSGKESFRKNLRKSMDFSSGNNNTSKSGEDLVYFEEEEGDIGCVLHSGGSAQRQGFPIILATADEEEMVQHANKEEEKNMRRRGLAEQKVQSMLTKRPTRTRSYSEQSYHTNDDARTVLHAFLTIPSSHSIDAFQTSLEALITFLKQELTGGEVYIPPSLLIASMTSDRNHGTMMQHIRRQRSSSMDSNNGTYGIGSAPGTTSFVSPRRSMAGESTLKNQLNPLAIASAITFDVVNRPCTLAIRLLFENEEQSALAASMNVPDWHDEATAFLAVENDGGDKGISNLASVPNKADDPWAVWSSSVSASVLPIDDENEDDALHCDSYRHWKVFPLARIKRLIEEQYPNLHILFYADDGSDHIFELNEIPEVGLSVVTQEQPLPINQAAPFLRDWQDDSVSLRISVGFNQSHDMLMVPQSHLIHKYHWGYPYYTPLMPTHSEYSDELILWRLRNNLRVLLDMGPSYSRPWMQQHTSWTYQLINHSMYQHNPMHAQHLYSSLRQPIVLSTAKRDIVTRIMNRLRWLLVLFHTALPFSAPKDSVEYSDSGDAAAIDSKSPGHIDQILQYYDYRDEALCKAVELSEELLFHHVLLLLEPEYRGAHVHQAHSAYASVSRGGGTTNAALDEGNLDGETASIPIVQDPYSRTETSSMSNNPLTVSITDQFLLVLQDAILCGAYEGNDLGMHDYGHELRMRSVFQSIFAPHCLDVQVAYTVLNAIPLPVEFDPSHAQSFVNQLSDHIEAHPDCGFFEDLGYLNISLCHHRNVVRWQSGVKRFLLRQTFLPSKDLHHHPSCCTSGLLLSENTVFRFSRHMNDDIRDGLRRLLDMMPAEIDVNAKEFHRQMQAHSLQADQQLTTFKGRQTRVGVGPQMSALGSFDGAQGKSRRAGQRMLLRFQSHEYDVLWAYLLSEIVTLNRRIRHWRDYLKYLLRLDVQGWKDHVLHHLPGRKCDEDWQDMFLQLQAGMVPNIWCSGSLLYYIFEAGYDGSRCSQHLHHSLGHHQHIPIEAWMRHMFLEGHAFLLHWLQSGQHPKNTPIPWQVLTNPEGLLFALKEAFCMQTDTGVDKVSLHSRLYPMPKMSDAHTVHPSHQQQQQQQQSSEEQVQSLGCYLQFGPVYLLNGLYSQRLDSIELLPSFYVMQHGGSCQTNGHVNTEQDSALCLHVWVSLEAQSVHGDQYHCPLHLRSMTSPRSLIQRDQHTLIPPLLRVPCNTTEDIQECEIQRMALFAAPNWLI